MFPHLNPLLLEQLYLNVKGSEPVSLSIAVHPVVSQPASKLCCLSSSQWVAFVLKHVDGWSSMWTDGALSSRSSCDGKHVMQASCCNIHFIDEGMFQVNTSQCQTCFKEDFTPEDMPRKLSLCTWTLVPDFPEVLIVPDALQDIRSAIHSPSSPLPS